MTISPLPPPEAWHALDALVLLPNAAPASLPTLAETPLLARTLPAILAHARSGESIHARSCLADPKAWHLVALRMDPYTSLVWGDAAFLHERASRDPAFAHECAPTVRLSYQPFCGRGNDRTAKDAALHFVVLAGAKTDETALRTFRRLREDAREAIGTPAFPEKERASLAHCNAALGAARSLLVEQMREWKKARSAQTDANTRLADFERQAAAITAASGLHETDSAGRPRTPLSHPALTRLVASADAKQAGAVPRWTEIPAIHALLAQALAHARTSTLLDVRAMMTGFGSMRWSFSALHAREDSPMGRSSPALAPEPVRIFATKLPEGVPFLLVDLGAHDDNTPDAHPAVRALPAAQRARLAENAPLDDVQANPAAAWRAAKREAALADPGRSHASTQSCYACHLAQERATMALRVVAGEGPREFGYFFRQAGYQDNQPWISRRALGEARHTAFLLNIRERP